MTVTTNVQGEWPAEDLTVCALCSQETGTCDRNGVCPNGSPATRSMTDTAITDALLKRAWSPDATVSFSYRGRLPDGSWGVVSATDARVEWSDGPGDDELTVVWEGRATITWADVLSVTVAVPGKVPVVYDARTGLAR